MSKPAYFVFDTTIKDPDRFKPYLGKVEATVEAFGGKRLVLGGEIHSVEGAAPKGVLVILQFPDVATASSWYNSAEYQEIIGHRLAAADCDAYLVEGLDPAVAG